MPKKLNLTETISDQQQRMELIKGLLEKTSYTKDDLEALKELLQPKFFYKRYAKLLHPVKMQTQMGYNSAGKAVPVGKPTYILRTPCEDERNMVTLLYHVKDKVQNLPQEIRDKITRYLEQRKAQLSKYQQWLQRKNNRRFARRRRW